MKVLEEEADGVSYLAGLSTRQHAWSSLFNPFSITANLLPGIDKWMNYYWAKEQE